MEAEWFGPRLKQLREQASLSQADLAKKAGISLGGLRHIEQGRSYPNWETIIALCNTLRVSCEAFTQEPAEREAPGPGRPRKAEEQAKKKGKRKASKRKDV